MTDSFYVPDGDRFVSSQLTRGPWDPDSQHAGPPAALIGRALERCPSPREEDAPGEWHFGRMTFEILRAVPIAPLRVEARVARPGRSVELVEATLTDDSEVLIRATAWRLRAAGVELPAGLASKQAGSPVRRPGTPAGPGEGADAPFFPTGEEVGYHSAMERRFVAGSFLDLGPATVWMRTRHPLVHGEQPTPLQRVLIAADSGNGVSATLDYARYLFINVDLSVHLHRLPAGEWVCLEAITTPEPAGVGLADTLLHDQHGPIGRALQTLLVRERSG
ncbi:MAG: thioesterase family protein [Solirubrobacterales bacterium]